MKTIISVFLKESYALFIKYFPYIIGTLIGILIIKYIDIEKILGTSTAAIFGVISLLTVFASIISAILHYLSSDKRKSISDSNPNVSPANIIDENIQDIILSSIDYEKISALLEQSLMKQEDEHRVKKQVDEEYAAQRIQYQQNKLQVWYSPFIGPVMGNC